MRNKNALTRYRLIDNRMTIRHKTAPSLQDIVDYVSDKMGTTVSVSMIQKDIYAMRYDESLGFNAPIEYSQTKKGYIYTDPEYSINHIPVSEEDLQGLEIAIGILEQFKEIPAIKLFDDAIQKIASSVKLSREKSSQQHSILLLDRPKRYQGIEFMSDIVEAIHHKNVLRVNYLPFTRLEAKKHTIHPYFIKEYHGRMYLIGKDIHPSKEAKFLTFAFDRMQEVICMNQTFEEEELDKENYFQSTIGISLPGTKPEHIVLEFDPLQANYLKSQPLHHSQKIKEETNQKLVLTVDLVINYELIALLLSFGDKLKVLQPKSLVKQIAEIVHQASLMYK